jgi:hypothetical protein
MPVPDCWRPKGAHPASCSALNPILAMRTDACHRRKSLRALTTHDPRSALAWYPMAHQSVLCDGLRGEGRLGWRGRQQIRASLGLGSGDRFGAPRGGSGSFKARGERAEKPARLQGKRATKRLSQVTKPQGESSMVRRGSTVRVRQRALQNPRKSQLFLSARLARSPVCGGYGAGYGAFRLRTPSFDGSRRAS